MKIRIKGNSIRYRLTKTEVDNFSRTGILEEQTEMAGGTLYYALEKCDEENGLSASFHQNKIIFLIPQSIAKEWTETNITGFENRMKLANGHELFLLIEKDFVCLDNTFEDQSDNYPNPNAVC
ncbi:MAG: hypothetical protein H7296_15630 [Bacteroidia bacterium]|nr:hypothetical protein [Bacteroidia bacterium]